MPVAPEPTPADEPPASSYDSEPIQEQNPAPSTEIITRTFRVSCTKEKLVALSGYMNDNDIEFEKL